MHSKFKVKRESVYISDPWHKPYTLHRWVVRRPDGELYGYSTTWMGAMRMISQVHVRKDIG